MTNNSLYSFLKSLTIAIPLIISIIKFNKMDKCYYPFVVLLLIGCLKEIIHYYRPQILPALNNAALSNIYVLIEFPLILWLFKKWNFFKKTKAGLYILLFTVSAVWVVENIIYERIMIYSPYYRILYYCVIVLLSINIINYNIIHDSKNLFLNARFVICLSFIFFFTYKLMYEWAYQYCEIYHYEASKNIIISSFGYVNMFENIVFIIAVLIIPKRNIATRIFRDN